MPFLGQQPAEGYKALTKQTIAGSGATVYTLDYKVTSANDLEVFVNNVRQEPGVAYTASSDQITFTSALEVADDCYVVFQGRAVTSNLIESQNIADGSVTRAKTSGLSPVGGGSDEVFYENDKTVTTNYTITTDKNAMTAGPVVINDGVTVTVPTGSRLVVV